MREQETTIPEDDGGSPAVACQSNGPDNILYDGYLGQPSFAVYHDGHRADRDTWNRSCIEGSRPRQHE